MSSHQQIPLDLGHRSASGMADFLVAPCNQDAVAWVDRWPEWSLPALILYGPRGAGKSHLAHVWRSRCTALLVDDGSFPDLLPDRLGDSKFAVIDPLELPFDEEALLHLYNVLAERSGHLLIVAGSAPARWDIRLRDLRSRLLACPAVGIGSPNDGLIGALMIKQFADRQLRVEPYVLTFLLARMERSFSEASRLVAALDRAALAEKRRITVPLARRVLETLEMNR